MAKDEKPNVDGLKRVAIFTEFKETEQKVTEEKGKEIKKPKENSASDDSRINLIQDGVNSDPIYLRDRTTRVQPGEISAICFYPRSGTILIRMGVEDGEGKFQQCYTFGSIYCNILLDNWFLGPEPEATFDSSDVFIAVVCEPTSSESDRRIAITLLKEGEVKRSILKDYDKGLHSTECSELSAKMIYKFIPQNINYDFSKTAVPTLSYLQGDLLYNIGGSKYLISNSYGTGIGHSLKAENVEESLILVGDSKKMFLRRESPEIALVRDLENGKEQYMLVRSRLIFDIESDESQVQIIGGCLIRMEFSDGLVMAFSPNKIVFGDQSAVEDDNIFEFYNGVLFAKEEILFLSSGKCISNISLDDLESGERGVFVRWNMLFTLNPM